MVNVEQGMAKVREIQQKINTALQIISQLSQPRQTSSVTLRASAISLLREGADELEKLKADHLNARPSDQ